MAAHQVCLVCADMVRHLRRDNQLPPPQLVKPQPQAELLPAAAQERASCKQALLLLVLQQPGQQASHVRLAHALPPPLIELI